MKMDPTPIGASNSADQDAAYDRLVERYSAPETLSAALARVTAEARRRATAREAEGQPSTFPAADAADARHETNRPLHQHSDRLRLQSLRGGGSAGTEVYGAGSGTAAAVAPSVMTGGRTRPRYHLALEALVSTAAEPHQLVGMLPEHQRICHLCREIKSVAEIAALTNVPIGVARILVIDLAEAGIVAVHQPQAAEAGSAPAVSLLERVLSGLRKL